jgi:DNA mismatch repair protein MutS2
MAENLSTFSAHMASLAAIVGAASKHSLVLLDEVGVGTDPGEGAALAQAILETLADKGCRVIATTHYNLLKEMADVDPRFCNASVEFDPETLAPTYRLHLGTPGASSATAVAARMGMPNAVLDRAIALLDREDRQLDRMLSELSASRAALDEEQRVVSLLRAESEAVRSQYLSKLERLHERRDKLVREMRKDLDRAFKEAHGQVAAVIRRLQHGTTSAQEAAGARSELLALQERAREAETESQSGLGAGPVSAKASETIDWRQVGAGDRVRVPGGGTGILESLPDRRGRVRVQVGTAQLVIAADQIRPATRSSEPSGGGSVQAEGADLGEVAAMGGGTLHCDLRGLRVEDALDRLAEAIDHGLVEARDELRIVHGFGTGALRRAVRESLARSPFVTAARAGAPEEGGDGVTFAEFSQPKS